MRKRIAIIIISFLILFLVACNKQTATESNDAAPSGDSDLTAEELKALPEIVPLDDEDVVGQAGAAVQCKGRHTKTVQPSAISILRSASQAVTTEIVGTAMKGSAPCTNPVLEGFWHKEIFVYQKVIDPATGIPTLKFKFRQAITPQERDGAPIIKGNGAYVFGGVATFQASIPELSEGEYKIFGFQVAKSGSRFVWRKVQLPRSGAGITITEELPAQTDTPESLIEDANMEAEELEIGTGNQEVTVDVAAQADTFVGANAALGLYDGTDKYDWSPVSVTGTQSLKPGWLSDGSVMVSFPITGEEEGGDYAIAFEICELQNGNRVCSWQVKKTVSVFQSLSAPPTATPDDE